MLSTSSDSLALLHPAAVDTEQPSRTLSPPFWEVMFWTPFRRLSEVRVHSVPHPLTVCFVFSLFRIGRSGGHQNHQPPVCALQQHVHLQRHVADLGHAPVVNTVTESLFYRNIRKWSEIKRIIYSSALIILSCKLHIGLLKEGWQISFTSRWIRQASQTKTLWTKCSILHRASPSSLRSIKRRGQDVKPFFAGVKQH